MTPPPILLVEDSPDDVFFLRRALQHARVEVALEVVPDGETAMAYLELKKGANRRKAPLPKVILLDLSLPRISGLEVLAWVRAQPHLHGISVVVLTGSREDSDMRKSFELGAATYLVKPPTVETIEDMFGVTRLNVRGPALGASQPVAAMLDFRFLALSAMGFALIVLMIVLFWK